MLFCVCIGRVFVGKFVFKGLLYKLIVLKLMFIFGFDFVIVRLVFGCFSNCKI